MFPQLRKLEEKYPNEVVILGIHTGKFNAEKDTANIRQAVLKNEIRHPVANDGDHKIWDAYHVQGWPTMSLIDPTGKVVGTQSGEAIFSEVDTIIVKMIEDFDRLGQINRRVLNFQHEKPANGLLNFPGKVLAQAGQLFISDTNNNRVLVATLDGEVKDTIGSGKGGFKDGTFAEAQLNKEQGMALRGDLLYIADTENHAVRVADLKKRTVETVAGNGKQGYPMELPASGRTAKLNSPWDIAMADGALYVAMAGTHQLWEIDPRDRSVRVHAGSGREGLQDGRLAYASLAQPSGITTDGAQLYFADAEVSAVRMASVAKDGQVRTLVGHDLFVFGDKDGVGDAVRMQHTLGVCLGEGGVLYVADGYNHKIKRLDPKTRKCETVLGTGIPGKGADQLDEPTGVSYANGKLYIADTNNHRIQVFDVATKTTTTLALKGLPPTAAK